MFDLKYHNLDESGFSRNVVISEKLAASLLINNDYKSLIGKEIVCRTSTYAGNEFKLKIVDIVSLPSDLCLDLDDEFIYVLFEPSLYYFEQKEFHFFVRDDLITCTSYVGIIKRLVDANKDLSFVFDETFLCLKNNTFFEASILILCGVSSVVLFVLYFKSLEKNNLLNIALIPLFSLCFLSCIFYSIKSFVVFGIFVNLINSVTFFTLFFVVIFLTLFLIFKQNSISFASDEVKI